jgi:hypothetical protein
LRVAFVLAGKIAPDDVLEEVLPEQEVAIYDYKM